MKASKTNRPLPKSNLPMLQKRAAKNSFGTSTAQLQTMEEDEMQMKQDTAQLQNIEEDEMQMKQDTAQTEGPVEEEELQMKQNPTQQSPSPAEASSQTMPQNVKNQMEGSFQTDFSDVQIKESPQANQVGALAYTQGNEITFAPGKFQPHNQEGQELLGHELAHVLQQRSQQVQATTQSQGLPVNDDPVLENEADLLGKLAARKKNHY
ncbi:MAG: DUF4157 domain-containing protein [Microscillaceae bacterium]|nr:DUF4157 domain-containing protein [Microscillaceae bacterium]